MVAAQRHRFAEIQVKIAFIRPDLYKNCFSNPLRVIGLEDAGNSPVYMFCLDGGEFQVALTDTALRELSRGKKTLIVDDEQFMRSAISNILNEIGFEYGKNVGTGEEAGRY